MEKFLQTEELTFIMDETDNILIKNFSHFYISRLNEFRHAEHVLDIETKIIEEIDEIKDHLLTGINFRFEDSISVRAIQLSDVLMGFLGKYFTYIKNVDMQTLENNKLNLTSVQVKNIDLLSALIQKSDELAPNTLESMMSVKELEKNNYFLWGVVY